MKYTIIIVQGGILTGERNLQNGYLVAMDDSIHIELEGVSSFKLLDDTRCTFDTCFELDDEFFDLKLIPTITSYDDIIDEFEIEENQDFLNMKSYLLAKNLNEKLLNNENKLKKIKI